MATKTRTGSRASRTRATDPTLPMIPDPYLSISASTRSPKSRRLVPTLILRGDWLAKLGFPIGASAFVVSYRRGEMLMARLGRGRPRRLRIIATSD